MTYDLKIQIAVQSFQRVLHLSRCLLNQANTLFWS